MGTLIIVLILSRLLGNNQLGIKFGLKSKRSILKAGLQPKKGFFYICCNGVFQQAHIGKSLLI